MSTLAVICKAPVPGRVKTRLCPPCTPQQAADLADSALRDTFDAVRATPCDRRVAVLDGEPGAWLGEGLDVIAQHGGGLDDRLANAFADLGGPTLIIGMDTPQVTTGLLTGALAQTIAQGSAIGMTADGGYWCIGLASPDRRVLEGVPMSTPGTGAAQLQRMLELGLSPALLGELVDVDDIGSARVAASAAPVGRFARAMNEIDRQPVTA